jgi:hypothetical protein
MQIFKNKLALIIISIVLFPLLLLNCGKNRQQEENLTSETTNISSEKNDTLAKEKEIEKLKEFDRPKNGDKPYDNYFRNIKIDLNDLNCLRAINDTEFDALISIVQKKNDKTIRCVYLRSKENFLISRIPNGKYYIKIYIGNSWNKERPMKNGEIRGGFEKNARFEKFPMVLKIEQSKKGDSMEYYNGEWKFFEMLNSEGGSVSVKEEEFFSD